MRRALRVLGKTLIGGGFILLAYIAWLLWGTGIYTSQAQGDLRDEFNRRVESAEPTRPVALKGDAFAVLEIPKIDLDVVVVEGTEVEDLKRGPGHYSETAVPWEDSGTVGIAGHRTTYGAPFWSLNELTKGDTIFLRTERGDFRYEVTKLEEVAPTEVSVLDPAKRPRLVLTTCAPRFSAARRLIVYADRV
ncbi:MAG TPA: sortase [Actinomycetota bacterium]|nr:sortase [Actinomycetota bacterium]